RPVPQPVEARLQRRHPGGAGPVTARRTASPLDEVSVRTRRPPLCHRRHPKRETIVSSSQCVVSVSALLISLCVAPYVFVGGGAVTTKQHNTDNTDSFTKGAGKFGAGLNYQIPRSRVAVFVEGTTWVYKWQQYGYDKTQFDVSWNGGVSYTF